jgi:hypothetical protein
MKLCWGSGGIAPFLTSALGGCDTHWVGGWVGPIASFDAVEWRKISCPCQELIPGRSSRSPFLYRLIYPGSILWYLMHIKMCFLPPTMTLIENTERHCYMLVTRHRIWIYCCIY